MHLLGLTLVPLCITLETSLHSPSGTGIPDISGLENSTALV